MVRLFAVYSEDVSGMKKWRIRSLFFIKNGCKNIEYYAWRPERHGWPDTKPADRACKAFDVGS